MTAALSGPGPGVGRPIPSSRVKAPWTCPTETAAQPQDPPWAQLCSPGWVQEWVYVCLGGAEHAARQVGLPDCPNSPCLAFRVPFCPCPSGLGFGFGMIFSSSPFHIGKCQPLYATLQFRARGGRRETLSFPLLEC